MDLLRDETSHKTRIIEELRKTNFNYKNQLEIARAKLEQKVFNLQNQMIEFSNLKQNYTTLFDKCKSLLFILT